MSVLRSATAACAIGLICMFAVPSAKADIIFCNDFPHLVYVAIAYPQTDNSNSWISRGWLNVGTGDCTQFDTALHVNILYYRAESVSYRQGGHSVKNIWGGEGDAKFAIWKDNNFNLWNAQTNTLNSALVAFTKAGETSGDALSVQVTFGADGIHVTRTIKNSPPPAR